MKAIMGDRQPSKLCESTQSRQVKMFKFTFWWIMFSQIHIVIKVTATDQETDAENDFLQQ
jgi:hypothetical protein